MLGLYGALAYAWCFGASSGYQVVPLHTGGSMKFLTAMLIALASMLASSVSSAQTDHMGNAGGMWGSGWMGGYGGHWWPILLVVVVGVVVWAFLQKRK
jgi:hypothetical protein